MLIFSTFLLALSSVLFTLSAFETPILDNLYSKIKPKIASILCVVLISLYLTDLMYTKVNPNTGEGISEEVEKIDVK